jgi:glycosyltransferase involved in cell wall biosynthesis
MAFPLSENGVNILRRRGYTKEVTVFPNGVDLRMFYKMKVEDLRSELGLDQTFVIGYVGRILRMKGLDTLVEAISQLNMNCKILLVGRGEYRSELEKLADQLVISERIVWIDGVPPEDVPKYVNCMDTLVLPSRTTPDWVEFFGRVLVEAMACQVPVIGSDSGEIPNVIGNAGLTFPEGEAKLLADQIQMIAQDLVLRSNLIQLGLERVEEFSWETIAQRTLEVYRDLV